MIFLGVNLIKKTYKETLQVSRKYIAPGMQIPLRTTAVNKKNF